VRFQSVAAKQTEEQLILRMRVHYPIQLEISFSLGDQLGKWVSGDGDV